MSADDSMFAEQWKTDPGRRAATMQWLVPMSSTIALPADRSIEAPTASRRAFARQWQDYCLSPGPGNKLPMS